jgi:biopolymer transport protein ExbD
MYKSKLRRNYFPVDVTAMCDITFVILVFFALTSSPKPWEPITIEEPGITVPPIYSSRQDGFAATILMGYGKVMFKIPDEEIRRQTLLQIGLKYHIKFSAAEVSKFAKIETVGVRISQLKKYIDGYYDKELYFSQVGIPVNSTNDELTSWIYETRVACKYLYNIELRLAIDADKRLEYPDIKNTISILQRQHINKFELITTINYTNGESNESRLKTLPMGGNRSIIY